MNNGSGSPWTSSPATTNARNGEPTSTNNKPPTKKTSSKTTKTTKTCLPPGPTTIDFVQVS